MKNKLSFFLLVLAITFNTFSCSDEWFGISGSGQIISEQRSVSGFKSLELDFPATVEIVNDSVFSVEVSDYENLLSHISTGVKGETLIIRRDPKNLNMRNSVATVKISMPSLERIQINGSGNITVLSGFPDLNSVNISGSGNVTATAPSDMESLEVIVSGSGKITLAGTTQTLNIDISGSGNFYGFDLEARKADCEISGSGNAYLNVEEQLKATISGSGNILYKGHPVVSTNISGSGKISSR